MLFEFLLFCEQVKGLGHARDLHLVNQIKGLRLQVLVLAALLPFVVSLNANTQEAGEEGGGEVEIDVEGDELDYSDVEEEIFDYEAFTAEESQLQIADKPQAKGIGTIHEAARMKTSISLGEEGEVLAPVVPEYYVIQKGDTLFYLSEYFFGDPELWPGIWALNPEITNPNWIYPGQALLLAPTKEKMEEGEEPALPPSLISSYAMWKKGTEYVRPIAFIDKDIEEETGKIIGSFEETNYLDVHHKVYIKYKKGKAPSPGDKATIYKVVSEVKDKEKKKTKYGKMVRILGTVKIDSVDKDHRIAKGTIVEAVRPIQREDLVGPIKWKFNIVPPVKGSLDLEGKVIAPLEDVEHAGQHDIIFINLGKNDGLIVGNVLTVLRKRDHYQEVIGKKDKSPHFPWEKIGKVMVIESLKKTATCLIVESNRDIVVGDKVELRRGK